MVAHLVPPQLTRYRPRQIRFIGLCREQGVALKVYAIACAGQPPDATTVAAGAHRAMQYLAEGGWERVAAGIDWSLLPTYGLGTVIVHQGEDALFVLVDYWVGESMLRHHVWAAPLDAPTALQSLAGSDIAVCVWELAVLQHERLAWLRHVHTGQGGADIEAFLADVLNADL